MGELGADAADATEPVSATPATAKIPAKAVIDNRLRILVIAGVFIVSTVITGRICA
jgi:hypothetical protein